MGSGATINRTSINNRTVVCFNKSKSLLIYWYLQTFICIYCSVMITCNPKPYLLTLLIMFIQQCNLPLFKLRAANGVFLVIMKRSIEWLEYSIKQIYFNRKSLVCFVKIYCSQTSFNLVDWVRMIYNLRVVYNS